MARTPAATRSFVSHARLIGAITLVSRVLGLLREMIAAAAFGAGPIWSAFTFAFTIPNLFRKLFGEGALSAAFIPMYARIVGRSEERGRSSESEPEGVPAVAGIGRTHDSTLLTSSGAFAAGSVNLLVLLLTAITIVGELILGAVWLIGVERDDYRLMVVLTAIMLPYVVLICGAAFLGGILNVHEKFAGPAAASVLLNLCLIVAIVAGAWLFDLSTDAGQAKATVWLAVTVVLSGGLQVLMLWPGLRAVGFRFDPRAPMLTPLTRRMLWMSLPVALSAGVLQISVLLDKGIGFFLAGMDQTVGPTAIAPMLAGAAARLNWAQFMYQFPLGVFAIALATAIFPMLSRDAAENDGRNDKFRNGLRHGIEAAIYIGLPASAGLVLVSHDATRVLFERGLFTPADTKLVAMSVAVYSAAIWAFSLQQILSRAFYALEDTRTPMVWAGINLGLNLVIELPLIWLLPWPWGEVGLAAGTLVSFSIQAVVMTWLLSRRLDGIGLRRSIWPIGVMMLATGAMVASCLLLRLMPAWPMGDAFMPAALRLLMVIGVGSVVYFGVTWIAGVGSLRRGHVLTAP